MRLLLLLFLAALTQPFQQVKADFITISFDNLESAGSGIQSFSSYTHIGNAGQPSFTFSNRNQFGGFLGQNVIAFSQSNPSYAGSAALADASSATSLHMEPISLPSGLGIRIHSFRWDQIDTSPSATVNILIDNNPLNAPKGATETFSQTISGGSGFQNFFLPAGGRDFRYLTFTSTNNVQIDNIVLETYAVPEPSFGLLVGAATVIVGVSSRSRNQMRP